MRKSVKPRKKNTREIISPAKDTFGLSVGLIGDLQSLIESTRIRVAVGVNAEMVLLYWDIGERIRTEILSDERAAYGKQVIDILSEQLSAQDRSRVCENQSLQHDPLCRGFSGSFDYPLTEWTIELDPFQEYHLC